MNFFAVACGVRGDLRCFLPRTTGAFEILPNLLAAAAGCIEVFLREAFDLRGTASPCCNFVTDQRTHEQNGKGGKQRSSTLASHKVSLRDDPLRWFEFSFSQAHCGNCRNQTSVI
jgi:hypothetical protein